MKKTAVKICGLRLVESAVYAVKAGADFIGLVFHPNSKRNVNIDLAVRISEAVAFNGGIVVAVVVDQNASEIMEICSRTGINHVQFHGENAITNLPLVGKDIIKILSVKVSDNAMIELPSKEILQSLNPQRDYLLYDGQKPGSGERFAIKMFYPMAGFRFFIAGGLNANNVAEVIEELNPYGVDVSSGVESSEGIKDPIKINQFIEQVNSIRG